MAKVSLSYDSISVNGFNALDSAINYLDTVINYLQQNSIPSDFYRYNTLPLFLWLSRFLLKGFFVSSFGIH